MQQVAREKCFPLSLSQQNILSLERTLAGTSVNNISTTIRIHGRLDFFVLQQSIQYVLESDASLRSRLVEFDGEMLQYHVEYMPEDFPVFDFTNTSEEGIRNWENAVTRELIPLTDGPLYRFILFKDTENSGGVLVKLHHIIADGWSQINICNKIAQTYLEVLAGNQPTLEPAPDYELHVQEEQAYLKSKAYERDRRYWENILSQAGEPSVIKSVNSVAVSPVGRRMSFELPQILNHAIYTFCREKRVAPFAPFYMALAIYFKRIGGAERFTVGVPIFNRTNFEFKQSTGMFVTTVPFYNEINDEWSLEQFNDVLMENWYEMLRHQRFPFRDICALSEQESRLFHIALSYQDSKIFESRDASVTFSGRWHYCGYQAEQLTIHLTNLKNHQQYAVDYDYLAQFFTEEDIAALHRNLCRILSETLAEPQRPIHRLNVLSLEEKEQVLYAFNQTDRYVEERSVYDALAQSSVHYLNRAALIQNGERMSYGTLLHRGTQFASALAEIVEKENGLAAILLPRGFDLVAAMVGSLQVGCAYLILSDTLPTERIRTILQQSHADVLITDAKGKMRFTECDTPMLCTEIVDERRGFPYGSPKAWTLQPHDPAEQLAYVVYTSGSTGTPKGVEITQRNLLNLAQEMESVYGQGAVLSVCNVGFDAFMLESIVALLNGRTIVLPTDADLEFPERLAALMNSYAVGFLSITPSRLSVFLQNNTFRKGMWRMESIVCGGEAFPTELLKKLKSCTHARIYNQYGPSETTVAVSMKELSQADKITAGVPMGNCRLYVLDQWMNPLPIGGNGRLFVGGKCVGRGYRLQPELTAAAFHPSPFVSDETIYDTGDLAYWTPNGEIVLTGRADRQVKLNGLRIELQEVAACVEAYPHVTTAYATVRTIGGQQVLGVYYCVDMPIAENGLLSHVATYLPPYMIPAFLLPMDQLPMSANGKVDESKLPLPQESADESGCVISDTAAQLLQIFRNVLGRTEMNGNSDYFLNGGNSLNAMSCVMEIEAQLRRKVRVGDLYACRTAARLAAFLDGEHGVFAKRAAKDAVPFALKKAPNGTEYELTPTQQGMYIQSMLDPNGLSYHMPGAFRLEKEPNAAQLEKAFIELIRTDAIFRTVFVPQNDRICARVLDDVPFQLTVLTADDFNQASQAFLQPFDLAKAPLLRAALWQSAEGVWYLFVDSHHIIGDGMSTPLLLQRLDRAYCGQSTAPDWTFYDYTYTAQQEEAASKTEAIKYWTDHLQNLPEVLQLPTDFVRPQQFDYKGREYELCLSEEETKLCADFCQAQGYTLYMLFVAAYGILLSAVSGRDDFLIGTPVAGRNLPGAEKICGPFINTLPLRLKPQSSLTGAEWLKCVQQEVADMLDHPQVSLEELIGALNLPRGAQNALYQVMLTQSPVNEDIFALDGKKMTYCPISTGSVKMDLITEVAQKNACIALRFSYATSLFKPETIAFYASCLRQIVHELIQKPNDPLERLHLMTPQDYEKYVEIPNFRVTPFVNRPIHKLLKSKAEAFGDKTAVIFHGEKTTFAQLERRASAIAAFIEKKGLKPGQCVGLCLRRTPDLIAAMYGVLKAGCAYMFMLENFPEARMRYMLEIAEAGLLLYDAQVQENLPAGFINGDLPCEACLLPEGELDDYADRPVTDEQLVNVLFTSGSTGKPKGVMLRHRSIANLHAQMKSLLAPIEGNVLCSTNSVFDCFVVETLIALALGRTVVMADEEEMMLPWKLAQLVETYQTGIFEMTPSRLQLCLGNEAFCAAAKYIRIVLLGGEVLTKVLLEKFYAHSNGILMNMYGPTEATVFTTMGHAKVGEHITIGKPLQNTRTYVLDENMRPVLPTACGEMYIAGECLAGGYISRPELTKSMFVQDIYFPDQKMYRSGDLVRMRLDGSFDYIGRKDGQVKLNGQRVELSEINGAAEQTAGVQKAATVAVRKTDGSMELCTFYVTDGTAVAESAIYETMQRVLPKYMIPSRLVYLAQLPMTATNKTDIQTLQKMAAEPIELSEKAEPSREVLPDEVGEQEEKTDLPASPVRVDDDYVLQVWNQVLSNPASDVDASFFAQGGTSMAALSVLSRYYNDRLEMSLAEFYENPTVRQQVQLLRAQCGVSTENLPEMLESSAEDTAEEERPVERAVLVTGATGFFGAHLVFELLKQRDQKILCLVRGGKADRLYECLIRYFGEQICTEAKSRMEVIDGDLAQPQLGLSDEVYGQLADRVDEIYHCAADVRHYAADESAYMKINVGGTEQMLALAKRSHAAFYHMSTCSVSGDFLKQGSTLTVFTEQDLDIGQIWEDNIYVKSKFLAEQAVFRAMEEGVHAKIFRLGRLVGRASDGKFQPNPHENAFYLLMKAFYQIGALPIGLAKMKIDLMPIDESAKQVLLLTNGDESVYHIMNADPPELGAVLSVLNKKTRFVDDRKFSRIFFESGRKMDSELWALVMDYWRKLTEKKPCIHVTNQQTVRELDKLGYVSPVLLPDVMLREFWKGK